MRLLLLLLTSVIFNLACAEEFYAKVIVVMDGDTVMVLRDGKKIKVRLANIDAPESAQEFGKESRQALADRVLKKKVHVNSLAVDSYGRMIAEISLDGQSVNEEQVRKGMAWQLAAKNICVVRCKLARKRKFIFCNAMLNHWMGMVTGCRARICA